MIGKKRRKLDLKRSELMRCIQKYNKHLIRGLSVNARRCHNDLAGLGSLNDRDLKDLGERIFYAKINVR